MVFERGGSRDAGLFTNRWGEAAAAGMSARLRALYVACLAVSIAGNVDYERLQFAMPDLLYLQSQRSHFPHGG